MRNINLENEIQRIVQFIKDKVKSTGLEKLIIGLSGGIDSAVSAALSVKAVGAENVMAFMLPYRLSNPASLNDALEVAKKLNISYQVVDISPMVDAYFEQYDPNADALRRGNRMARERMCVLYDMSAKYNGLVVGTGNKSEIMIGYFTQYGDGGCAFEPIGHLYKYEVKAMAKLLELPDCVINKKPTADLWEGQTDEDEMGLTYDELDRILQMIVEDKKSDQAILEEGVSERNLSKVKHMILRSEFKRNLPDSLENVWDF